jgi:hypothetical protein
MIYDVERNEYTRVAEFNSYGADGWELVTIYQHGHVEGFDVDDNKIQQLPVYVINEQVAIFKRMTK